MKQELQYIEEEEIKKGVWFVRVGIGWGWGEIEIAAFGKNTRRIGQWAKNNRKIGGKTLFLLRNLLLKTDGMSPMPLNEFLIAQKSLQNEKQGNLSENKKEGLKTAYNKESGNRIAAEKPKIEIIHKSYPANKPIPPSHLRGIDRAIWIAENGG